MPTNLSQDITTPSFLFSYIVALYIKTTLLLTTYQGAAINSYTSINKRRIFLLVNLWYHFHTRNFYNVLASRQGANI
jgi:hypothetical protein